MSAPPAESAHLIILPPAFIVAKHIIGFGNLLKAGFRLFDISGIFVRVELDRQFTVGLFDFLGSRIFTDTQDLIVIF